MSDLRDWPALVLTAGLATRLRPLSALRAKAALPVAGRPLIGRIFEWLQSAGVRRVVVNLHHRPETVAAVVGDGSEWGLDVRYSWERRVLGSAGGPRRALPLLDAERFLIINGDTLTNCDLRGVAERHADSRARVTMAVVAGDVARYGGVLVDDGGIVRGFSRASASAASPPLGVTPYHFIGVQAVESNVFVDLPDDEPSETVRTLYPSLIAADRRSIAAFVSDAEFLDIGTPANYWETVAKLAARERQSFDRGADCKVAPDASVTETILWDRVTVDCRVHLHRCVVVDDVHVPEGAAYENAVLTTGSTGLTVTPFY